MNIADWEYFGQLRLYAHCTYVAFQAARCLVEERVGEGIGWELQLLAQNRCRSDEAAGGAACQVLVWNGETLAMSTLQLALEDDLVALLRSSNQPLERAVRELMILELYRRGALSSGKAAELMAVPRLEFIHYASSLGIPYFNMSEDEWDNEKTSSQSI